CRPVNSGHRQPARQGRAFRRSSAAGAPKKIPPPSSAPLAGRENLVLGLLYDGCWVHCTGGGQAPSEMYSNPQKLSSTGVLQLRREAGRWLKELREAQGLSQRRLAELVGAEYYTFISQLEAGRGRIPPNRYLSWALALGVEPRSFVRTLLRYY